MEKRSFEVVVEGQYYALHDSVSTVVKKYQAKFVLPSQEAALSNICKHLLKPYLEKNYPDFIRFRTHQLVSITAHGRKPDPEVLQMGIDEMNIAQLSDFCILRQIMIDPYKHSDLPLCRERVMEAWRVKRRDLQDRQEGKAAVEDKEINELRALNNLPPLTDGILINHNEQKANRIVGAVVPKVPDSLKSQSAGPEDDAPLPPEEKDVLSESTIE